LVDVHSISLRRPGRDFSAPGFFMTTRHAALPVFSFASAHSEQPRCLPEAKAGMNASRNGGSSARLPVSAPKT
jgi:hypothetical protein